MSRNTYLLPDFAMSSVVGRTGCADRFIRSPGGLSVEVVLVGAGFGGVWRLGSKSEDVLGQAFGLVNVSGSGRSALVDFRSLGRRVLRDALVWEELVAGGSVGAGDVV